MFVLILSRGYPREDNKVLGIFEMDQAKALQSLGIKVVYMSTDLRSIRRWRKWGYEKKLIDGIEVYGMNIPLGRVKASILDRALIFSKNFLYKKIVEEKGKPDIIHAHFVNQGYMGSLLKKEEDIPLVITEHSSQFNKDNISELFMDRGNRTYKNADQLITVSPSLQKRIKERFGIDSIYIPNIVDTDIFTYVPRERGMKFKFVSTGHLIPSKGNDITVRAFYKAFKDVGDVELKIFGEGKDRRRIEELIKELDLSEKVKLMGQCKREDIAKEYIDSDAFVLASKSETFGVSYIEALASGLPVLATRCGGPEAFINEKNGIFSDVDDVDSLAKNMQYLYENLDKFNRQEISYNTIERFSPEKIGEKIIDVYKNVIKRELDE